MVGGRISDYGGNDKNRGELMRTKGTKEKLTLTLRVYPEDALYILNDLYKAKKLSESQYFAKADKVLTLLETNKK